MPNITDIDKNFKVEDKAKRDGMVFYDIKQEPFRIYGVFHDGVQYRRMPKSVTDRVSPEVEELSLNTAGGRVRFVTDSPYIILKAKLPDTANFGHMTKANMCGFDMYFYKDGTEVYEKTVIPPLSFNGGYENAYDVLEDFVEEGERTVTVNFPLYGYVYEVYIGIKEGSVLKPAPDYKIENPIVYYGSSITQGGCSSRPGLSYQGHISRRYDANYVNLGFSGNGKGETAVAEYIASLDMSAFVFDYDHNSPNNEHYAATHEPFFKIVRAAHPDIPVIFMTRPRIRLEKSEIERVEIARKTYLNAVSAGDKNVYFIDGRELMEYAGKDGTVDRCHPNDLGFYSMALRIFKETDKLFETVSGGNGNA